MFNLWGKLKNFVNLFNENKSNLPGQMIIHLELEFFNIPSTAQKTIRVILNEGEPWANCRVSCKWCRVVQEVRFKVHDPKAHSKGGTLENTINGRADEEAPPAPQHLIHPGKDISKLYGELLLFNLLRPSYPDLTKIFDRWF